jgi:hypothetical protein
MRRSHPTNFVALATLVSLCACGNKGTQQQPTCIVSSVAVLPNQNPVAVGVVSTLGAVVNNAGSGCTNTVAWSLATFSGSVSLTATGNSTATFSATTDGSYSVVATSQDDKTKSGSVIMVVGTGVPIVAVWEAARWDSPDSNWQ